MDRDGSWLAIQLLLFIQLFIIHTTIIWGKIFYFHFIFFFLEKISVCTKMNHVILLVSVYSHCYTCEQFWDCGHNCRRLSESAAFNGIFLRCQSYIFSIYVFNHLSTLQLLMTQLKDMHILYIWKNFKQCFKNIMSSYLLFSQRCT